MSQRRVLDQERSASHTFLDQMVRLQKDRAFIIHFDREVELLQDLTSSHEKLEAALGSLTTPQFMRSSSDPSDQGSDTGRGSGRHHMGGGTLLYDAVYLASDELMKKQQGRKALIVLSDGVDRGSEESLETAVATAQRARRWPLYLRRRKVPDAVFSARICHATSRSATTRALIDLAPARLST
jgi:VWFA-related protein